MTHGVIANILGLGSIGSTTKSTGTTGLTIGTNTSTATATEVNATSGDVTDTQCCGYCGSNPVDRLTNTTGTTTCSRT